MRLANGEYATMWPDGGWLTLGIVALWVIALVWAWRNRS